MFRLIVNEHHRPIPQTAIAITLKLQRCLHRGIAEHAVCPIEALAVLVQSFQEEIGVVEARDGKARQRALHVAAEVLTILTLKALGTYGQRIIIEHRGDIRVVLVEILKIRPGIQQPVGVAEHRDVQFWFVPRCSICRRRPKVKIPFLLVESLQSTTTV